MKIKDKVVVVTGAASGIGKALAARFTTEGARGVVCADVNESDARAVAAGIGADRAMGMRCDVSQESDMNALVVASLEKYGAVDIFCSNAGIIGRHGLDATLKEWRRTMDVNFMAHVLAARAVVPVMIKQGGGYIVATASAAGLLMQVDSATYTVSKHAAVAFAEWLSVTYGDRGVRVGCLCPMGVNTPLLHGDASLTEQERLSSRVVQAAGAVLEPEEVADVVVEALAQERFLVLPHPEVLEFFRRKADDYDRWLAGMRRLQARIGD
jgi:NAD(P)-dependent dehydrogenase (short-subunit alcohol dehydrogenase family)